jgi:Peptidase MA superfamily
VVLRAALAMALVLLVVAPAAVRAAEADFGEPTATATWGEGIEFLQPVTLTGDVRRVEVLLDVPGGAGPAVIEVPAASGGGGQQTLRHELLTSEGHIYPNTTVSAQWRVVGEDGSEVVGPAVTARMEDDRFEWQVREGDVVRVHWYSGGEAFGDRALEIAEQALVETQELLGVTEEAPIDFYVYGDQQAFYDALGPGTWENVGGVALADLRTLFALIPPEQIDDEWVGIVIPHEMVHLVFDTATLNPYHFPPRWLNEGVAVYQSQGYDLSDRALVEQAARDGSLIPIEGLTGQFPTTRDRFFLAYAESVSAVDFLIREHEQDALVQLIGSYADGLTDDEAFEQAIGMDVAAFDAAWRGELGVGEPTVHGPQPPPAGPLPPGWTSAGGSPGPTLPPGSQPGAGPGAPTSPDGTTPGSPPEGLPLAVAAVAAVAIGVLAIYVAVMSRRRGEPVPADGPTFATEPVAPAELEAPADAEPVGPADPGAIRDAAVVDSGTADDLVPPADEPSPRQP